MWNQPEQGVLPAATGVVFHAGNVPQIRNAGQDWATAGQNAIQAIAGILQQRRNDAIANQLLAADQKQTQSQDAYDPTGAVAGGDQTSALVNPPTQDNSFLHRAMVGLGLSSNAPDLGGVDALKVHDQIQKQLQDQEDRALNQRYVESQITHNQQGPAPTEWQTRITHPELFPAPKPSYDPNDQLNYKAQLDDYYRRVDDLKKEVGQYDTTPEELASVDTTTPGAVKYVSAADQPLTHTDQAPIERAGYNPMSWIGSKTRDPNALIKAGDEVSTADAQRLATQMKGGSGVNAVLSVGDKEVTIPYETYKRVINLSKNIPKLPERPVAIGGGQGGTSRTGNYIVGKPYKDANGNVSTYLGNGQWK